MVGRLAESSEGQRIYGRALVGSGSEGYNASSPVGRARLAKRFRASGLDAVFQRHEASASRTNQAGQEVACWKLCYNTTLRPVL